MTTIKNTLFEAFGERHDYDCLMTVMTDEDDESSIWTSARHHISYAYLYHVKGILQPTGESI